MNNTTRQCLEFGEYVRKTWKDDGVLSTAGFQKRYLMSMLMGLLELSRSYWTLREAGHALSAKVLARNILERQVKSILVHRDPQAATELIAQDIEAEIDGLKKWENSERLRDFASKIAEKEDDLATLRSILSATENKKIKSVFGRFDEAGLENVYRSIYRELCGPTHGDYTSSLEPPGGMEVYDFFANVAPVESAMFLHLSMGCSVTPCDLERQYNQLTAAARSLLPRP